jgi:hypothetical protein
MHHALPLAGHQAAGQRAGFAGLVAGHRVAVGDLEALAPDEIGPGAAVGPVGGVGGQDAVAAVAQDVRLGQGLEEGDELGQGLGVAVMAVRFLPVCLPDAATAGTRGQTAAADCRLRQNASP